MDAITNPLLSVVIPSYNEASRIGKTLESVIAFLRAQPYSWEIVVVDDGSSDRTAEIVQVYTEVALVRCQENRIATRDMIS
jgi:glycosyltransferase involved in cell wall biosynthesis